MPLSNLLSIARSALLVSRRAMDVTANNVANAQTPGYSRQRLDITPLTPLNIGDGFVGRGVTDNGVFRVRDQMLDAGYRRENGLLGQATTTQSYLTQIESALGEPTDGGLGASLDNMFKAFGDLANDPSNPARRDLVRSAAGSFTSQLRQLAQRVQSSGTDAVDQMRRDVTQVNSLSASIADLNARILASPGPIHNSAEMQDQRDRLIDQLSGFMNVTVTEHQDGTIAVTAGDTSLVDGATAQKLVVRGVAGGGYGVANAAGGGIIDSQSGSLAALATFTQKTVPAWRRQLDQLASAVVNEVNAVHSAGYTATGATGVNFFDPNGTSALTIDLSSDVKASGDAIAAGGTNAKGDASVALQLAGLGTASVATLSGKTMRDFYVGFAADVGIASDAANRDSDAQQTLVDGADAQRDSISGVSIDEEMVNLMNQQQAYGAAARLVTAAQDMMDTVLQMLQ